VHPSDYLFIGNPVDTKVANKPICSASFIDTHSILYWRLFKNPFYLILMLSDFVL